MASSTVIASPFASSSSSPAPFTCRKTSIFFLRRGESNLSSSLLATNASIRTSRSRTKTIRAAAEGRSTIKCFASSALPAALLFDCDGVLVDTDKDGHRISFNDTFSERELGVT